jgi:hypothetical protein
MAEMPARIDAEALTAAAERARVAPAAAPLRTVWHGVYDAVERSLSTRFFLRDERGSTARASPFPARTVPVRFDLGSAGGPRLH